MATELAKAYVQIVPSASGIKGKLTEELGGESESAGASAGKKAGDSWVSTIKNIVVAAGIGTTIKEALDAGGALQQSFGGLDTIYGDASAAMKEYAQQAVTAGISANDYAEQAVSFGASLKQAFGGDTVKAAEAANTAILDMADNAAKMGTDIESIQNAYQGFAKGNYTMLDNLSLGYGGTREEMERLLKQANKLNAEQGIITDYSIDNLGDVYEAIHVVQQDLGLTDVAADEAATTFSGSMGAMKAAAENLLANLTWGEDLAPALATLETTVFTFVEKNLLPMLGKLVSALPEVLESAMSFAIDGMNKIAANSESLVQTGVSLVSNLAVAILSALPYLAEAAINLVGSFGETILNTDWAEVGNNLMSQLRESSELAAGEIFGADGGIVPAIKNAISENLPSLLENGVEIVNNIIGGISEALPGLLDCAVGVLSELGNGIINNLPQLIDAAAQIIASLYGFILENLPTILQSGADLLLSLAQGILDNLPEIVSAALSALLSFTGELLNNLPEILEAGITIIGELVAGILEAIPKILEAIPEIYSNFVDEIGSMDWLEIGSNIIDGLISGIKNGVSAIGEAAKDVAESAFNAAKDFLGIHSPSTLFAWIGKQTDAGLAEGLTDNTAPISDAMNDITKMVSSSYDPDISVRSLVDYSVSGSVSTQTSKNNQTMNEKFDRMIYLLEALTSQEPKIYANNREVGRVLKDMGVQFA